MNRKTTALIAGLIFLVAHAPKCALGQEFTAAQLDFFETSVRPVLIENCLECHGAEKQESDLRLDSREAILRGGLSGEPAAVAGDAEQSVLFLSVTHRGDFEMPPEESLDDVQIDAIRSWINSGLAWPVGEASTVPLEMSERVIRDREQHWSYQPIVRPSIPRVRDDAWPENGIDQLILSKLESNQLSPSPDADKWTLLRRLKFDLLGIPPTSEEVKEFLADDDPNAYERWVERYLASPLHGERWGRHWLDVARYGDTRGYAFARDRRYPFAYTYRDYVIDSLNADKPYDRFVVEQLAADSIQPPVGPEDLAALGFLTTGRRFNNIHDDIDDQIDAVTRGLIGLTVACARCHDHKYDAIPTEDYYSLYGVFVSTMEPGELPLIGKPEEIQQFQEHLDRLGQARRERDDFVNQKQAELHEHGRATVTEYLARVLLPNDEATVTALPFISKPKSELNQQFLRRWRGKVNSNANARNPIWSAWSEFKDIKEEEFESALEKALDRCRNAETNGMNPVVAATFLEQPPTSRLEVARIYGTLFEETYQKWKEAGANDEALRNLDVSYQQLGLILLNEQSPVWIDKNRIDEYLTEDDKARLLALRQKHDQTASSGPKSLPRAMVVKDRPKPIDPFVFLRGQPGRRGDSVPRRFVEVLDSTDRTPFPRGSGRMDLAERIVDPNNPLTARVIANRVWMHHFGEPLVDSPSDFGIRSERPTQSDLLDYLARFLMDQNWSLKALHREIVTSHAYKQSSVDRPDCRAIDPDNRLIWRMNRRVLEFEPLRDSLLFVAGKLQPTMHGSSSSLTGDSSTYRRAIYGTIDRQDLPNLLRAFDFASPDQSIARRSRTIVPQQALFLMNSEFVIDRARDVAEIVALDESNPQQSIVQMYQVIFARDPSSLELDVTTQYLVSPLPNDEQVDLTRWEQLAQLLLLTNEFAYVD